jgi:hypothetical protein
LTPNDRSGKVGLSHYYLDRRLLHEIDDVVYEYEKKNILNNWYTLHYQEQFLIRYLILCVV